MKSASAEKLGRERGTPSHNPLSRPRALLFVLVAACSVLAALVCGYGERKDLVLTILASALGAFSSVAGLIYADSGIHAMTFGLAVFTAVYLGLYDATNDISQSALSAFQVAAGPLIVGMLARFSLPRKCFQLFSTNLIFNSLFIISATCFPLLSLLSGLMLLILRPQNSELTISFGAPSFLGVATLILLKAYYDNRSHKRGSLIVDAEMKGTSVATALAIGFSIQAVAKLELATNCILPVLVGSLLMTLLCAVFASVADVWYSVGTGQFIMVSIDTAGILFYFVAPCVLLFIRFLDRYGVALMQAVESLVISSFSHMVDDKTLTVPIQHVIVSSTLLLVGAGTMVGVPLVSSYCPLGAHLFGWAYVHGQPNTKTVALCVRLRDIIMQENTQEEQAAAIQSLCANDKKQKPALLNIFVSHYDLVQNIEKIKEFGVAGHCIGITGENASNVVDAYVEYVKVLKMRPKWYLVWFSGSSSRAPSTVRRVSQLDMKTVFWSTHFAVSSLDQFLRKDVENLGTDLKETNGGSIVALENVSSFSNEVPQAIVRIIKEFSVSEGPNDVLRFSPLSSVAKEEPTMDL